MACGEAGLARDQGDGGWGLIAPAAPSMQLLAQLLQQARGALALLVVLRQLQIARERAARRQQVPQPRVDDAPFPPQLRLPRCNPEHALQSPLRAFEVALLDAPHLD